MSKTDKQDRPKKRRGDRRDATLVRDTDTMHKFMPYLIPGRCNNEAFIEEFIDLEQINAFLEKKNASDPEYRYTLFYVIAAAFSKVFYLRPHMSMERCEAARECEWMERVRSAKRCGSLYVLFKAAHRTSLLVSMRGLLANIPP